MAVGGSATNFGGNVVFTGAARFNGMKFYHFADINGGKGCTGIVEDFVIYKGDLILAGSFLTAGGRLASRIARWDGSRFHALGSGANGTINALTVFGDKLLAGGFFSSIGGVATHRIGSWDGTSWSAFDSGLSGSGFVTGMATVAGVPYYTALGPFVPDQIGCFTGAAWVKPGSDTIGGGRALGEYQGDLVGSAVGASINNISTWDGVAWTLIGTANGNVYNFGKFGDHLVASGRFTSIDGVPAERIAYFDGTDWNAFGDGLGSTGADIVHDTVDLGNSLYAFGSFSVSGSEERLKVARWGGKQWERAGIGLEIGVAFSAIRWPNPTGVQS